jgi:hypothetical protein
VYNLTRLICVFICIFSVQEFYAITSSTQDGNWSSWSIWDNGSPGCGDTIYVSSGNTVTVDMNIDYTACGTPMFLVVEGTLQFKNGPKLKLPCGSGVLVKQGGQILGGGGKGSQNEITICGVTVWIRSDGDILTPTPFGAPFSEKIKSIASTNWGTPSTWDCNCDPHFYHDATIDTAHTVSVTMGTDVNDIHIYGILDASSLAGAINVYGDWDNTGSFMEGASSVLFKGSIAQQVTGNTDFYNLSINNANGVSIISGNINIFKTLDLTSGNLSTNNSITLVSNASGTARIAEITGGSISGDITMQRYINAGATDWRFLTSPIAGTTLADFNDDFITSGFAGSDYPLWPTAANPWASIYYYDETQPGVTDSGFVAATNVTNSVAVGEGIWVWSGDTITGTQPFTIDVSGSPNVGNISLPLTYTNTGLPTDDGWNMVGNPYPSTLDWDSPNITKSGINNAIYVWNPDLQQFASYVFGIGTNGGSNNIASSQAFWVQANASPSVTVTESSKTSVDGDFLKQPSNTNPFRISVQNSYGSDELAINFESSASTGIDMLFDARKMTSVNTNLPNISSVLNGIDYSINQFPSQEIDIPIKILSGISGMLTISIENTSAFGNVACLILEDLFTGTTYDLSLVSSFPAFINSSTTTARFLLHIGAPINISTNDISCFGNNDAKAVYTKNTSAPFDITWKDLIGNVISSNSNILSDSLINISEGSYVIETTDNNCANKIDTVVIYSPNQINSYFSVLSDTIYLSNGGNVNFTNQSTNAIYYDWDFDDATNSTLYSPSHVYSQTGNYFVSLIASQSINCFETYNKLITVLSNPTGIDEAYNVEEVKVWISNDNLNVIGTDITSIEIRNILGQLLFTSRNTNRIFNLEKLSSQTLIVSITKKNQISSTKVQYLKN